MLIAAHNTPSFQQLTAKQERVICRAAGVKVRAYKRGLPIRVSSETLALVYPWRQQTNCYVPKHSPTEWWHTEANIRRAAYHMAVA